MAGRPQFRWSRRTTARAALLPTFLGPANALPSGTVFKVRMSQDIDAGSTTPNTPFKGTVAEDVVAQRQNIIPVGSELHGRWSMRPPAIA